MVAQAELGTIELEQPNYSYAITWLKKSAALNNDDAEYGLAFIYTQGVGVLPNPELAIHYIKLAAEHRHFEAVKEK